MTRIFRLWTIFLLSTALVCLAGEDPQPRSPSTEVQVLDFEWTDAARQREVPAKIYLPKTPSRSQPIVIFSHGLGGSRDGYEYFGRYLAGCGYVCVHLQHHGSDDAVWKEAQGDKMQAMTKAAMDIRNAIDRPKDVSFALDQLTKLNAEAGSPLAGQLDLHRVAVAGHSFGGFTAMAIAGQGLGPRGSTELTDPRVKCAIEMSAPVPRPTMREHAYDSVKIPVFHMSGTKDDSPIGDTKAADRRIPYELTKNAETCLIIFNGGDHMTFSGRAAQREEHAAEDAKFQKFVCIGSVAFLDAFLSHSDYAHDWLMKGAYKKMLGDAATFDTKRPQK